MPLVSAFAGAAARAYGFLARSLTFFGAYYRISGGGFAGYFKIDSLLNSWSAQYAPDQSYGIIQKSNLTLGSINQIKFTSPNVVQFNKITTDSSNRTYVLGFETGYSWLALLDSNGSIIWQKKNTEGFQYIAAYSNGVYATSYNASKIVKYDSTGAIIDKYKISYSTNNLPLDGIATDSSDNLYVYSGNGVVGSTGSYAGITKLNSSGVVQWQKILTTGAGLSSEMAIDGSGNIYTVFASATNTSVFTKIDSSGTIQWQKEADTRSSSRSSVFVDGTYVYFSIGNYIYKFDISGTLIWQRIFQGLSAVFGIYANTSDIYLGDGISIIRTKADTRETRTLTVGSNDYYVDDFTLAINSGANVFGTPYTYAKASTTFTDLTASWSTTAGSETYYNDAI